MIADIPTIRVANAVGADLSSGTLKRYLDLTVDDRRSVVVVNGFLHTWVMGADEATLKLRLAGYVKYRLLHDLPLPDRLDVDRDSGWTELVGSEAANVLKGSAVAWATQSRTRSFLLECVYDLVASGDLAVDNDTLLSLRPLPIGELQLALYWLTVSGYLERDNTTKGRVAITGKGMEFVERLRRVNPHSGVAFGVLSFTEETNAYWQTGVGPALHKLKLQPVRIDANPRLEPVVTGIQALIEVADLVVADLTFSKPNCYYEVGWAHALEKRLLLTVRADQLDAVQFDLKAYNILCWRPEHLDAFCDDLYAKAQALLDVPIFP